jgi:hypothetical protein
MLGWLCGHRFNCIRNHQLVTGAAQPMPTQPTQQSTHAAFNRPTIQPTRDIVELLNIDATPSSIRH